MPKSVREIARLAHIHLTDEEVPQYQKFIDDFLVMADEWVKEVDRLDLSGVKGTPVGVPMKNVMRDDEVRPSLPVEVVMAQAPDREGDYFRVQSSLVERPLVK